MPYAEIVIRTVFKSPAERDQVGYHYHIPPGLDLEIGHLVWVPFGPRQMQGVVMALLDHTTVEDVKDIAGLVDPRPLLSQHQVQLARWMAEYYCCSIGDAVALMLPAGIQQRSVATLWVRPGAVQPSNLTEKQLGLLRFLQAMGKVRMDRARASLQIPSFSSVVSQLARRGLILRGWELEKPRVRARVEKRVCLKKDRADAISRFLESARAPSQSAILRYLNERTGSSPDEAAEDDSVAVDDLLAQAGGTPGVLKALLEKGFIEIEEREVWRDPLANRIFIPRAAISLTEEQQAVYEAIAIKLVQARHHTFLLHGVTGSGKTEIYLKALQETLRQGKQAIIMVPEIALTPQAVHRFATYFAGRIAVWHSGLSPGERYDEWRRVRDGALDIVIGSRSAVFAPLRNLGLIVVDEEHEWSYKHERTPRYHARDVAIELAKITGAQVILGSATPDVVTYFRANAGQYSLLELQERVESAGAPEGDGTENESPPEGLGNPHANVEHPGLRIGAFGQGDRRPGPRHSDESGNPQDSHMAEALDSGPGGSDGRMTSGQHQAALMALLPPVHIVDLRQELRAGNHGIFGRALDEAIGQALAAREQVILFLNRRGGSTFIICRDCGHALRCKRCDVPLVYHTVEDELVCHQCNYRTLAPERCPNCTSRRIKFFGLGTQKVEEETLKRFPNARVLRWDSDAVARGSFTGRPGAGFQRRDSSTHGTSRLTHEQILQRFGDHEADILIGTQMIAKGLDLPLVTLVGIISADTILHLPDYRAGERTFQLLTQVAGRAGRGTRGGRVILQTYTPEHYCIAAASRHDYYGFYRQEIEFRQRLGYPPFSNLVKIIHQHSNETRCRIEAEHFAETLRSNVERFGLPGIDVLGPAPSYLRRLRGKYRWQIIVRGGASGELLKDTAIPPGFFVDVDPLTTL